MAKQLVVNITDIHEDDTLLVGNKGAQLGEMMRAGFPLQKGFIITTNAHRQFMQENKLEEKITHLINTIHVADAKSLNKSSKIIKEYIMQGNMSEELVSAVFKAYVKLGGVLQEPAVSVTYSECSEDSNVLAGQPQKYVYGRGEATLLLHMKEAWAALFDTQAIRYFHEKQNKHRVHIALLVQKLIEPEKTGKIFTINPTTTDKKTLIIEALYGTDEFVSQKKIACDRYEVDKTSCTIGEKNVTIQTIMLERTGLRSKKLTVPAAKRKQHKINDRQILQLAKLGIKLEKQYYFPQEIDWAMEKNTIIITNTKPLTSQPVIKPLAKHPVIYTEKPIQTVTKVFLHSDNRKAFTQFATTYVDGVILDGNDVLANMKMQRDCERNRATACGNL